MDINWDMFVYTGTHDHSMYSQWERSILEPFPKLTNTQENTETRELVILFEWPALSQGFRASYLLSSHHSFHLHTTKPSLSLLCILLQRQLAAQASLRGSCGADEWTQGAVALLSAWHQHIIKLPKFSCTPWTWGPRSSNYFPRSSEMGPRGGETSGKQKTNTYCT